MGSCTTESQWSAQPTFSYSRSWLPRTPGKRVNEWSKVSAFLEPATMAEVMSKGRVGLLILLVVFVASILAVVSGALPVRRDAADPNRPISSSLALTLTEFVTIPRSDPPPTDDPRVKRWARVNFLGEVPDRSGRLFVPDLNGKMYFIKRGAPRQEMPREYLDVGATFFPDFWTKDGLGSGFGFVVFHPEFAKNGKFYTVHTEAGGALGTKTPNLPAQNRTVVHGVLTEWTAADPAASTF